MPPPRDTRRISSSGPFRLIWEVVAKIPRGRVATYGQIARMAGLAGGARTVGWALRALPNDLRIDGRAVPWHRVVNAQGTISARPGSTDGLETRRQAALLRREGVVVRAASRIDLPGRLWRGAGGPRRRPRPAE